MALRITDECVNCGVCINECPNGAIFEGGTLWNLSLGTGLHGIVTNLEGNKVDANKQHKPLQEDFFYIVEDKCTECHQFAEEPQCVAVCCVESYEKSKEETKQQLEQKIEWLFGKQNPYADMNLVNDMLIISEDNLTEEIQQQEINKQERKPNVELKPKKPFWKRIFD